tara:strand:- start:478 stop:903 length:426 start_codon:yes stop_codon:yes gene_type:complete
MHSYFISIVLPAIQAIMDAARSSEQFFGNLEMHLDVSIRVTPDKETPSKARLKVTDYLLICPKTLNLEFGITEYGPGKLSKLRILADDTSNCMYEVLAEVPLTGKKNQDKHEVMHTLHGILAPLAREIENGRDVDPEEFLK